MNRVLISVVVIILVAIVGFYLFAANRNYTPPRVATLPTPTMGVQDTAPNVPAEQKVGIIIRHTDSSTTKVLVPKDQVTTYLEHLPAGEFAVTPSP